MDQEELVEIFHLHKKCGEVKFSDVVKAASGKDVHPIDMNDPDDAKLVQSLAKALNNYFGLVERAGIRYHGNRINDIGKNFEEQILEEIKKTALTVTKLGSSGYPDFEIQQGQKVVYLELKSTGNTSKSSTQHRMFYFSSGKKIKADARHLLVQIQMEEQDNKNWKPVSWEMRDLSELSVGLKTEFNANFGDLERTPLLDSSEQHKVEPKMKRKTKKRAKTDDTSTALTQETLD